MAGVAMYSRKKLAGLLRRTGTCETTQSMVEHGTHRHLWSDVLAPMSEGTEPVRPIGPPNPGAHFVAELCTTLAGRSQATPHVDLLLCEIPGADPPPAQPDPRRQRAGGTGHRRDGIIADRAVAEHVVVQPNRTLANLKRRARGAIHPRVVVAESASCACAPVRSLTCTRPARGHPLLPTRPQNSCRLTLRFTTPACAVSGICRFATRPARSVVALCGRPAHPALNRKWQTRLLEHKQLCSTPSETNASSHNPRPGRMGW